MFCCEAAVLKGFKGEKDFFWLFCYICFQTNFYLSPVHSKQLTVKVAVLRRTITNKQTKPLPRKVLFGVTSTDFWVGDSTELEAKSGRSLLSQREASGLVGPGGGGH